MTKHFITTGLPFELFNPRLFTAQHYTTLFEPLLLLALCSAVAFAGDFSRVIDIDYAMSVDKITRPKGFGMSAAISRKIQESYDGDAEQNCRLWMEDITGTLLCNPPDNIESAEDLNKWRYETRLGQDGLHEALCDGRYLCMLMNTIAEGAISKFNESLKEKDSFRKRENIEKFIDASINVLGCKTLDVFQVVDLFEKTNLGQVINGIYAVARKTQDLHPDWPVLGPKEAQYNPREFTQDQLNQNATVIGLQMGSNKGASQKGMKAPGNIRSINDYS